MDLNQIYETEIPSFLLPYLESKEMVRLKKVGLNCGVDDTSIPFFQRIAYQSRYIHSLGVALIIWHFTHDKVQTLSGLFHDISTPVFSHVIDFLYHDYTNQEYTEESTTDVIASSKTILDLLKKDDIAIEDICDYHIYPIADNDLPRLSADRLEYMCRSIMQFAFQDLTTIQSYYDDLIVSTNEEGNEELVFQDERIAYDFACNALECGRIFSSENDRYAMESLARVIQRMMDEHVLSEKDLYLDEEIVIQKMKDSNLHHLWQRYCKLNNVIKVNQIEEDGDMIVFAKKRYIDPYILNKGRLSTINLDFRNKVNSFLEDDFNCVLRGEYDE